MCGISGWFSAQGDIGVVRQAVEAMVVRQRHRGPDDEGLEVVSQQPVVVLGHNRLSIIDVSPDGHQPMRDPETGNVIVFNGEIYNFKTLREELSQKGHSFRSHSDTEVILKAYATWGRSCCERFRGIFAFALWDQHEKQLFIARDHLGVKPFYYAQGKDGLFIFASEVRALLASGQVKAVLDMQGLDSYRAYGSVQEPFTLIAGIRSLPPASAGVVNAQGFTFWRYWDVVGHSTRVMEGVRQQPAKRDYLYVQANIRLLEAVASQMVSDVTLGAFLSGGVDSSAIVSLMRQSTTGPIKTFSIIFDDPRYDERQYAAQVAAQNQTEHIELELRGDLVRKHLRQSIEAYDQPSLDGLNTWFVSKIVKEAGVTVALSGVGGDELFIGYGGFKKTLLLDRVQRIMRHLPSASQCLLEKTSQSEMMRKLAQMVNHPCPAYFLGRQVCSPLQGNRLWNPSVTGAIDLEGWRKVCFAQVVTDAEPLDTVSQISLFELQTYMLSTLLRDTDQMSMSHSLEVRVPLIDHEVVAYMLGVPEAYKVSKRVPKPVLVHSAGKGLPSACVNRPKRGFTLPFEQWLKGCLQEDMRHFFLGGEAHPVFSASGLRSFWEGYQRHEVSWSRIWYLYVLNQWLLQHRVSCS